MTPQILAIISSIFAIIIGLWRFFSGKERIRKKLREEASKDIKQGVSENDPSKITGGFDRLNRS